MNNKIVSQENISKTIFSIRDRQVMLDSDLAILYQIETKQLNHKWNSPGRRRGYQATQTRDSVKPSPRATTLAKR